MRILLACVLVLGGCAESPESRPSDDGGDPPKSDTSDKSDKDECVVEIGDRCFNYDPRESMGESAYARGNDDDKPDVLPARVAAAKHSASSWKRKLRYTEDPALAYARILVSEEGFFASKRARGAIWQVIDNVRAHHCDNGRLSHIEHLRRISQCETREGETVEVGPEETVEQARETYLSAMRRLSPHVTGVYDPKRDRQRWTSTLLDRDEAPAAWRQCVAEDRPKGCHGDWRLYEDAWTDLRAWATKVTSGRQQPPRPCPGAVIAWGGVMDDRIAKARGLVRIDCGLDDAKNNRFWAKPREGDAS